MLAELQRLKNVKENDIMVNKNIVLENARIGFRNFSGKEGKFNPAGRRNFCVFLESESAAVLQEEGWNIRWLNPRSEDDEPQAYLQAAVAFGAIPPSIYLVTSRGKTKLDEKSIDILDWAEIQNVDLIIRPYNWEANGRSGVKAYVKTMYVTIVEDQFESKYSDVADSALQSITADASYDD